MNALIHVWKRKTSRGILTHVNVHVTDIPIVRIGVVILDPSSHSALSQRGGYGHGPRPAGVIATITLRWSQHRTRRGYKVSWRARTKFPIGSGIRVKLIWASSIYDG